jgi:hypothetical protein
MREQIISFFGMIFGIWIIIISSQLIGKIMGGFMLFGWLYVSFIPQKKGKWVNGYWRGR